MSTPVAALSRKALLWCLFICCCNNVLLAQPSAVDSLQRLVSHAKDDTNKVKLLISLARAYRGGDSQKSIENATLAVELSKQLNSLRWIARSEQRLGSTYRLMRDFGNAILHLREAERSFRAHGDVIHAAEMYIDIGICYGGLGQTELALDTIAHSTMLYTQLLSSTDSAIVDQAKRGVLQSYYFSFASLYQANQLRRALEWLTRMEKSALTFHRIGDFSNIYNSFGATYTEIGEYEKAIQYYAKAMKLAEENNNWDDQQRLLDNISKIHFRQGDYNRAQELLQKAMTILLTHLPERLDYLALLYTSIADVHVKLARYKDALEYYLKALRLFDQIGNVGRMANIKRAIGSFYHLQSDFAQAANHLQQARALYEQIHNSAGVSDVLFELGKISADQGLTEEALAYHRQSLEIRRESGEKFSITLSMYEIGNVFLATAAGGTLAHISLPQLDSAAVYFTLAKGMSRKLGDKSTEAKCFYGLGRVEELRSNWHQARVYYGEAMYLSDSLGTKRELYESYSALATVSAKLGRHDEAYRYHQLYSAFKDSVFNETSSKQLKETQVKYDTEKKDLEIRSLNQGNEIAALKAKQQQSALEQAELQSARKETDIKLLNQAKELQQQQLLNANRALTERELEAKARSAELEAARKDQLLQEHNLQEQKLIMYGSIAFAVLTIALGVVLLNRFQLRKELDKRTAILEERRRISSDMHDDLGSSLSTIALLSQVMKQHSSTEDRTEAEKISNAAQQSLEKMSEIVWSLNPRNDKLENLVAYIRKYAMEYFENSPVQCGVTMSGSIPDVEITGEQRRNVFLTVKESLHNIIKHSGAGSADLVFEFRDHTLQLSIHDNGKGMDSAAQNTFGNGIVNMQRRMKEAGGEVAIENKNGTTVRLMLPLA
jgi:two-component system, NarL family, sensor histidine kinase UhpB